MKNRLFKFLAATWQRNDNVSLTPDLIVSVSFGTFKWKLASGTMQSTVKSIALQNRFSGRPMIVYGVFAPTADDEGNPEYQYREVMFRRARSVTVYTGKVNSTIEEAHTVKSVLYDRLSRGGIRTIVVCTDACHSRRAGLVWEREFREFRCKIFVSSFETDRIIEKDHPMNIMRSRWKWLIVNVGVYCLWLIPPIYRWFRKNCKTWRQPVTT